MLRARDFSSPSTDLETQRKRTKRQRFLELALPCAFFAALVIAAFFSTGHQEASRRFMAARAMSTRLDAQPTVTVPAVAGTEAAVPMATSGLMGNVASFHAMRRTELDSVTLLTKLRTAAAPASAAAAPSTPAAAAAAPTKQR